MKPLTRVAVLFRVNATSNRKKDTHALHLCSRGRAMSCDVLCVLVCTTTVVLLGPKEKQPERKRRDKWAKCTPAPLIKSTLLR